MLFIWLIASLASGADPCDPETPLDEAVALSTAAWIAAPDAAPGATGVLAALHSLKGEPGGALTGTGVQVVLRSPQGQLCTRAAIRHDGSLDEHLYSLLSASSGAHAPPVSLLVAIAEAAALHAFGPQAPRSVVAWAPEHAGVTASGGLLSMTFVDQRPSEGDFVELIGVATPGLAMVRWRAWSGSCPTGDLETVWATTQDEPIMLAMGPRERSMPLPCLAPGVSSTCVVPWDGGVAVDIHLDGTCPETAVHVTYGGRPHCIDARTCRVVPFQGAAPVE